jgi:hypothetical protein
MKIALTLIAVVALTAAAVAGPRCFAVCSNGNCQQVCIQ